MKLRALDKKTPILLSRLLRTGTLSIADVAPSRRASQAMYLASRFFDKKNFVPGFPEMIAVTNKEHVKSVNRNYAKLDEPIFSLATYHKMPTKLANKPDLLWMDIDDTTLIRKLEIAYYGVPTIYSSSLKNSKDLQIIVDSKEKKSLWTGSSYERKALSVGDYTTKKLLNKFHVERKSPEDLYGTILRGHVRFRNELLLAERSGIKLVMYVECSKKFFVEKNFFDGHLRKTKSETLQKIVDTIENRYKLEVRWCKSREACKVAIAKRLKLEERGS